MDARTKQKKLVVSFVAAVVLGAVYGIFQKMLYLTKGESKKFDHPYFVAFLLSVSMVMVYPIYLAKERWGPKKPPTAPLRVPSMNLNDTATPTNDESISGAPRIRKWLFFIPSSLDSTENVLKNISLTMISQSIVQMLRSTVMLYCALLALFFLKKKKYRHHWTSLVTVMCGVTLVGYSYLTGGSTSSDNIVVGLIVLQIGQLFGAVAFVAEEKFLGDFESLDPLILAVGEGLAGTVIFSVALPIL